MKIGKPSLPLSSPSLLPPATSPAPSSPAPPSTPLTADLDNIETALDPDVSFPFAPLSPLLWSEKPDQNRDTTKVSRPAREIFELGDTPYTEAQLAEGERRKLRFQQKHPFAPTAAAERVREMACAKRAFRTRFNARIISKWQIRNPTVAAVLEDSCISEQFDQIGTMDFRPEAFEEISIEDVSKVPHTTSKEPFVGKVIIQDTLSATKKAIAVHTEGFEGSATEPDCYTYYVDASTDGDMEGGQRIASRDQRAGLGVVQYMGPRNTPPWVYHGFHVRHRLKSNSAEEWAIYKAMQLALTEIDHSSAHDSFTTVIIFSDSTGVLEDITTGGKKYSQARHRIHQLSHKLRDQGVSLELHYCPGHRKIPGNMLADSVASRARMLHLFMDEQMAGYDPRRREKMLRNRAQQKNRVRPNPGKT